MAKKIIVIALDPDKDIAKVPAGAIPCGIVAAGENIKAVFEVDESAPLKAVEFQFPVADETFDATGFTFLGIAAFNDGETVVPVYCREM